MATGDRIKELRLKLGMSQEELGKKVGVKKAAINKYETGIVINLKRSMIDKLADALGATPAYLMGWEDKPEDDDTYLVVGFGQTGGPKKVRSPKEMAIVALNEVVKDLSVEEIEEVTRFARYTRDKKSKE